MHYEQNSGDDSTVPTVAEIAYPQHPFPAIVSSQERAIAAICELLGRFRFAAPGLSKNYLSIVAPYLSAFNDGNLMSLLRTIITLRHEEEADWRPSDLAFKRAIELIAEIYIELNPLPRAFASPSGEGTIRMTWRRPSGEVRVVVPGSEASGSYLYFQTATEHSIVKNISGQTVANYIARLGG